MKLLFLLTCCLVALTTCADAHRILALVPMPAKSHANLFERLVTELAKKGHEVTYVSAFKLPKPVANLTEVVLPNLHDVITANSVGRNMLNMRHASPWLGTLMRPLMSRNLCEAAFKLPQITNLIRSDQHFDLILGEAFLDESFLAGFSHKFQAPIIGVATFMPNIWTNIMVGNPSPAAYVPDPMLPFTNRMTFIQRAHNLLFQLYNELVHSFYFLPMQDRFMRDNFGQDLPPLKEINANVSLVLVNHHYSLAWPRPYVPNMVEIGGYHINPPKPLPEDLKKYAEESKDGFILFSMGSNLKSAQLPEEHKRMFLNVFAKLKQNVIWKFEDESLSDLPKNVKILKWLPQSDILAHPNIKLFITHGGLLSTTEAVHRGVPVVGIPIFGDQPLNMEITENVGLGRKLNYDDLSEESLLEAINDVLYNPRYMSTAKLRSELLRDRPVSAMDTALYWIEYVIRHKGAPHLRSAAQDLAWYQLYLVDVIAVLAVVGFILLYIPIKLARCLFRKFCSKKTETKAMSKNKKKN